MNLEDITPLILTYDEEANIERTIAGLAWARRIVVVDSGSTDATLEILARQPAVHVVYRPFDDFASQCNYGMKQITTPWVFSIDADYGCPPELEDELRTLDEAADGYEFAFTFCIEGHPLRSCLYPARIVLFRASLAQYVSDGHAHRLQFKGTTARAHTRILHDDRKPLSRWLADQAKYADLEVAKLTSTTPDELGWKDRLRKRILWAAPATLFYCLLVKGLALDGWPGLYYTFQRVYAEVLLSLKLLNVRIKEIRPKGSKQKHEHVKAANYGAVAEGGNGHAGAPRLEVRHAVAESETDG